MIEALDRHKRYIRGEVSHAVNLKFAPDIRFMADDTFDEASRIGRAARLREGAARRGQTKRTAARHGTTQRRVTPSTAG